MESLVVSLETAWKLQEAGFPQDVEFCWSEYDGDPFETPDGPVGHWGIFHTDGETESAPAAPTAQELADQLPDNWSLAPALDGGFEVFAQVGDGVSEVTDEYVVVADSMSEALARLWIKLQEQSHD